MGWMQSFGKKQWRKVYWRIRAAMKKAVRKGSKPQFRFQYDPYSYALNFDDGLGEKEGGVVVQEARLPECPESIICVFVVLAE
ncbi:UNVERIFIED_CONTAM: hypothetical protein Sradi_5384400 [Sesamum radiatum]|uniref:PH domain-containing protein n=1 Tax=Sesamum radiatum TaxID=300843 RepID=A0AAW2LPX9_SESRA